MNTQKIYKFFYIAALAGTLSSCGFFKTEDVIDPNSPSVSGMTQNPTKDQIDQLAAGAFSSMRGWAAGNAVGTAANSAALGLSRYTQLTGVFGREIYVLASNDPRWYQDVYGLVGGAMDNNNFLSSDYYNGFAQGRRAARTLEEGAENSTFLSAEEKAGVKGIANTLKAYNQLMLLNMQYKNGIRIDLDKGALMPGPFVSYEQGLAEVKRLLDDGASQLSGGASFPITMPSGFAGFNTPANFRKFNRALAARVAVYRQDWDGALTALQESFLDVNGSLTIGPVFTFAGTPDVFNPLFQAPNSTQATLALVHPSFLKDIEAGDKRAAKVRKRTSAVSRGGLASDVEPALYAVNTASIPIINNEELVLIYAEANIQKGNNTEALRAINKVRTTHDLPAYSGATTKEALIDEMLKQRRYSLFYLGHRWIDMRRYNRLQELQDKSGDPATFKVFEQMPRPFAEVQWDAANGG